MGMNASASLFYGIDLGEVWIPNLIEGLEEVEDMDDCDREEYLEKLNEILEPYEISIENYSPYDDPRYAIMIDDSQIYGCWDQPTVIDKIETKPEWREHLILACKAINIEFKEPSWLLTCEYS